MQIWHHEFGNMVVKYVKLCVRGYHIYNNIWEEAVGETLVCLRDTKAEEQSWQICSGRRIERYGLLWLHQRRAALWVW